MSVLIKDSNMILTEELVKSFVGKIIHVPVNKHLVKQATDSGEIEESEVNAWFAGEVAGYEKAYIKFDYERGKFLEKEKVYFNILLTDGIGYQLAVHDSEIMEITEEEWKKLITKHQATNVSDEKVDLTVGDQDNLL
ncbi:hypothetical protein ACSVDA_11835 [Cytobacillus sp. Hm23]